MTFKSKCPSCGRISYGWGSRCICGLSAIDILYEGRDYDSSVKDVNEPNHDLEYHNKKCEEENERVNREQRKE